MFVHSGSEVSHIISEYIESTRKHVEKRVTKENFEIWKLMKAGMPDHEIEVLFPEIDPNHISRLRNQYNTLFILK